MVKIKKLWSIQELREKLLYTLFILLLFRLGCGLAVPFINADVLSAMFSSGNTLDYLNMISGGALAQCAILALGVAPYINASIIVQLLSVAIPSWEAAKKEADGQKKIERYTRTIALVFSVFLSVGYYLILRRYGALQYTDGIPGWFAAAVIVSVFVAGAQMTIWLGNKIDEKGIGNGVSLIIFAGIVARWSSVYSAIQNIILNVSAGKWYFIGFGALLVVFVLASIWFVVYVSGAERRVPIQYAGRTNGRVQYRSQSSFIPLKLIMSGVLPIIFASTILSLPQTIAMFMDATKHPQMVSMMAGFNSSNWIYCVLYIALIFFFNYFYVSIQFDPVEMANNLRKNGGTIPGIRPGKTTSDYMAKAMHQLAGTGSLALALIALAPILLGNTTGLAVQLGGTSLLIVVSVATELMTSMDSYVTVRHHKGFLS